MGVLMKDRNFIVLLLLLVIRLNLHLRNGRSGRVSSRQGLAQCAFRILPT